MTIDEIQEQISIHRPTAVYLGRIEMEAFKDLAKSFGCVFSPLPEPDLNRIEFCKCPLYQVDSESHFGWYKEGSKS